MTQPEPPSDERGVLAARLRREADNSVRFNSPFCAVLVDRTADDVEAGGPLWDVLGGVHSEIRRTFLSLHLLGAVHRLVLEGRAPALARHYPSAGGDGDAEAAWSVMRSLAGDQPDALRRYTLRPIQTNEPGRSAALLGGFLLVARRAGLPLRLLEVGASAGLNLRWDRFRYESAAGVWGEEASRVRFVDPFVDRVPDLDLVPEVAERAGCDPYPIDPTTEEGRLTLMSYVWADQLARFELLNGAIEVARAHPAMVERADALEWLPRMMEREATGRATVVFHSMFLHYLSREDQHGLADVIAEAGARATPDAPLARLAMEAKDIEAVPPVIEVRLQSWPLATDEVIAIVQPHGPPVRWLGA